MTDDEDFLSPNLEASLYELKDIYRVLAESCDSHPELTENGFFQSLKAMLEDQARAEGVDLKSDAEWAAWLRDTEDDEPIERTRERLN